MPKPVPPRQARSRATVDRILTAAEDLFAERGEVGFTLPEVARRAQVSVGSIYRRFATREELLMGVFDRVRGEEQDTALSTWEQMDWAAMSAEEVVGRLVRDISRLLRDRESLMRAIMARRLTVGDDPVFAHGLEDVVRGAAAFERAIRASGHPLTGGDPGARTEFAYRLTVSAVHRWAAREIEVMAPTAMSWERMLDHLTEVIVSYLFG